jgi:hypothetical protein
MTPADVCKLGLLRVAHAVCSIVLGFVRWLAELLVKVSVS